VVGIELFAKLLQSKTIIHTTYEQECLDRVEEYHKLREYCNKQFKTISLTYNQTTPYVNKAWAISSKKYTFTIAKKKLTKKEAETVVDTN
jgi:hypothetical protein